jgi:hypothetical protein
MIPSHVQESKQHGACVFKLWSSKHHPFLHDQQQTVHCKKKIETTFVYVCYLKECILWVVNTWI